MLQHNSRKYSPNPSEQTILVPKLELSLLPTNHLPPCLLVRQVDQFDKLENSSEYRGKTPAASCGR